MGQAGKPDIRDAPWDRGISKRLQDGDSIMSQHSFLKRWLAAGLTAAILGAISLAPWLSPSAKPQATQTAQVSAAKPGDWTMFGGATSRNFVNLLAKNLPIEWDAEKKT